MSAAIPIRLRLSRAKGFDLQALSVATNGLECVVVARPTKWGNPYRVVKVGRFLDTGEPAWAGRHEGEVNYPWARTQADAARRAVDGFRDVLAAGRIARDFSLLRGKNLACWCPLPAEGEPDCCHAAVLLRLANGTGGIA